MKQKYKIKILELFKVKDIVVTKFPDPDRRTVQLFVAEFSEFGGILISNVFKGQMYFLWCCPTTSPLKR